MDILHLKEISAEMYFRQIEVEQIVTFLGSLWHILVLQNKMKLFHLQRE